MHAPTTQTVSTLRRVLRRTGLLPVAFGLWRRFRYWTPARTRANWRLRRAASGVPIPPSGLLLVTGASTDVSWFLESGVATTSSFTTALERIGRPIESFSSILDFGCGCGRVLRQWQTLAGGGPRIFGTDYNEKLVHWCQRHLSFVDVQKNELTPPLRYADASFDLCYAVSVFTHLPEETQDEWLVELRRVIKPEGILLVTLSGEGDLSRVRFSEQQRFGRGELVVVDGDFAGTNMCGAYHPEQYVREHWAHYFTVIDFLPRGAKGSPHQDLYVLKRNSDKY